MLDTLTSEASAVAGTSVPASQPKNDHAALEATVKKNGLLESQTKYYAAKLAYTLAMLAVPRLWGLQGKKEERTGV